MASNHGKGALVGVLSALVLSGCNQESGRPEGAAIASSTAWSAVVKRDARLNGLMTASRGQITRGANGFVTPYESARKRPLTVHLADRSDERRDIRIAGARRWGLGIENVGATSVTGALDEGRVVYREAFPSTDVVAMSTTALYEELWVLRDDDAPTSFRWHLTPAPGLLGPTIEAGGTAVYRNAHGDDLLRVGLPYAIDAAGSRHEVSVQWSADHREITFHLDHHGLPHPVVVDPPLTAVPRWTEIHPVDSPIGRSGAQFVYSPWDGGLVLFGGIICPSPCPVLGILSRYDSAGWTTIAASNGIPAPKVAFAALVPDTDNARLRLYGGWDGTTVKANEWSFANNAWANFLVSGVAGPREGAVAVRNAAESRLLLFGGQSATSLADFTYESANGSTPFVQMTDTTLPPLRRDHGLAYDEAAQRVLLFGGRPCLRGETCAPFADVWQRASGVWSPVTTTGTAPEARWAHGIAFDAARGVTVVYGGRNESNVFGDTFELHTNEWVRTVPTGKGPPARAHAALAYDPVRAVTVLFGGVANAVEPENEPTHFGDTWEYATVDLSCTTGTDCDTGFCVDGACCETASCGTCESCATNDSPGSCAPVTGSDPDSCADLCDAGTCIKPFGSICTLDSECQGGVCSGGTCCPTPCAGACESCATGTCEPSPAGTSTDACATTLCDGVLGTCPEQCVSAADCRPGFDCNPTTLRCQHGNGSGCTTPNECSSGFCSDGVCCDTACDLACDVCSQAAGATSDGVCTPAPAGSTGTPACGEDSACDGTSAHCPSAKACTASSECASGVCIASRCCKSLYDCGTRCSDDGSAVIDVATSVSTPCPKGCYFGACATTEVDCRASNQCAAGSFCSSSGECLAFPQGVSFDPNTPSGCTCRTSPAPGSSTGAGLAISLFALGITWARRRGRRSWKIALGGGAAMLGVWSCGTYDVSDGEPCRQAGYAIASRIHACTGDESQANSTYDRFAAGYTCGGPADTPSSYQCASDLRNTTCQDVTVFGTDLDRWIASSDACKSLLGGNTNAIDGGADAGNDTPSGNDACLDLAQTIAPKIAACSSPQGDFVAIVMKALDELSPRGCIAATSSQLGACRAELTALPCNAVANASSAIAWSTAPACSALLEAP